MTSHDNRAITGDCRDRAITAETVTVGQGAGTPVLLTAPLSFWGGFDSATGCVIEPGHPQYRASLAGKVMLMGRSKGSSSSSSVLAEALRNGTGPVAIIMLERDLIVALGSIAAAELYGHGVPVVTVLAEGWDVLAGLGPDVVVTVSADEMAASVRIV